MSLKSNLVLLLLFGAFLLTLSIVKSNAFSGNGLFYLETTPQMTDIPDIVGPDRVCLVVGSVIEEFFVEGLPNIDFYYHWKLIGPDESVLKEARGGSSLQTVAFTFSELGAHSLELNVTRAGKEFITVRKSILVVKGAQVLLKDSYDLCENSSLNLNAIDPATPDISDFIFEWQDGAGNSLGNTNNITISNTGDYQVRYYFVNTLGNPECENVVKTKVNESLSIGLVASKEIACPEDFIQISPSTFLFGEWFYQKNGGGIPVSMGSSQNLGFNPSVALDGYGDYTISFSVKNPDIPGCVISSSLDIKFNPSPNYDLFEVKAASECSIPDGELTIKAFTDLDQLYYVMDSLTVSPSVPLQAGQTLTFQGLESGVYSFKGSLGGCPFNQAFVVPLASPSPELEFLIEDIFNESCTETGKNLGGFTVKRSFGTLDAFYNLVDERGGLAKTGEIKPESELIIEVGGGSYYFEVFIDEDCSLPRIEEIEIEGLPQVDLPVVNNFNICESYDFIPRSGSDVSFTLIDPNGDPLTKNKGIPFTLVLPGEYTLLATHNSDPEICPRQQKFTVSLISAVDFDVEFFDQDCVGNQTYRANLKNKLPGEVLIRWYNELGVQIGTGLTMSPVSLGRYKLDVQPANSFACPIPPIEFDVKLPVLSVNVELSATPLCPFGPGATIELDTDFDEVDQIDWVFYDLDNNQIALTEYLNRRSIIVTKEGIYEAIVWNRFDCELGRKIITIKKSADLVNFEIEKVYTVCERFEVSPITTEDLIFSITYPDGKQIVINSGETFTLDQEGSYTIRGESNDVNNLICPNEKIFEVFLVFPIEFEPILADRTCVGEFTFLADLSGTDPDTALFTWTDENGQIVGNEQSFTTLIPGDYSLEVQPKGSFPCDILPKPFLIEKPTLALDVALSSGVYCPDADFVELVADTDFDEVATITWIYFDADNNEIPLIDELNKKSIFAIKEGRYEVAVFYEVTVLNKVVVCELGRDFIIVEKSTDFVSYEIEESYTVCENYSFSPSTNENLIFTLTYPNGQVRNAQEIFVLDQTGTYKIKGEAADAGNSDCSKEKTFMLTVVSPIEFEPRLINQSCGGEFTFEAYISGTDPNLAIFTWRNENDQVVGDQQLFITSIPGNYSLEVQPKGSLPCVLLPKDFVIMNPVLALPIVLNAGTWCPEAEFAVLFVETDFEEVDKIEWWFTDINGNESALDQVNKQEIFAFNDGTYEVRIFNALGCLLGEDRALVLRSADMVRPQVKEYYLICAQYEIGETINPGVFESYNWFLNDSLVSSSPNYKPQLAGEYSLLVNSAEGCEYPASFLVEEECELKLALPNAIRPGDPERGFLVYTNYLVDEMEVWVFNKWGTLVFHCVNKSLISEESTCFWDGMIDGEKIPNGAYAIKIAYKNIEKNINKTLMETILVID